MYVYIYIYICSNSGRIINNDNNNNNTIIVLFPELFIILFILAPFRHTIMFKVLHNQKL